MKPLVAWLVFVAIAGVGAWLVWTLAPSLGADAWQRYVRPGELSMAHAFLADDCGACHTAIQGPDDLKCVSCHAADTELLTRQSTAFHADVSRCGSCHVEHLGAGEPLRRMDHDLFARIVLEASRGVPGAEDQASRADLIRWITEHDRTSDGARAHQPMSARSAALDCYACHETKDRHQSLFGPDCRRCHMTTEWAVERFLHPSADSALCEQCHRAPPSHYMMHFEMVSVPVARGESGDLPGCCGPVTVDQCYRCHQPTSWNDIKDVGWYKHH